MPESSTPDLLPPPQRAARGLPTTALAVAGALVAIVVGAMIALGGRHPRAGAREPLPPAPYASHLALSGLAMSESTSLSGGKSTFLDGHLTNNGQSTVTAVTVQVFFKNSEGMPPHLETLPLALIRTRQPYVDTQPVAASPLAPGDDREFRLIFEEIPNNWDTQLPDVRIVQVTTH